jgi:hypothetical protein
MIKVSILSKFLSSQTIKPSISEREFNCLQKIVLTGFGGEDNFNPTYFNNEELAILAKGLSTFSDEIYNEHYAIPPSHYILVRRGYFGGIEFMITLLSSTPVIIEVSPKFKLFLKTVVDYIPYSSINQCMFESKLSLEKRYLSSDPEYRVNKLFDFEAWTLLCKSDKLLI